MTASSLRFQFSDALKRLLPQGGSILRDLRFTLAFDVGDTLLECRDEFMQVA